MRNSGFASAAGVRVTPRLLAERLCSELGPAAPRGVLDPACGDGALLIAAWESRGRDERLAREGLFGLELDPALAARARARLRAAIGGRAGDAAARRVRCADALDPRVAWPRGTHVVANPPWVSLSGRQAASLDPRRRALYVEHWRAMQGWPSLHGAFLERIARHVAAHGTRARVLLPASVCDQQGYGALRREVTRHAALAGPPEELGERSFPGITEPAVLVGLEPRARSGSGTDACWGGVDEGLARWLERMARFPRLPVGSFRDPGVHTGNAAAELVVRDGGGELPGLREGRDLAAFSLRAPRARLRLDVERGPGRRFRVAALDVYRAVPVLLRQTADRPIAAVHATPGYFRNSLLACTPPASLDPAFVVAVLNAAPAAAWHRARFRDARQRAFPQVKVGHLASQPFPFAERSARPALHDALAARSRELAALGGRDEELRAELDALVAEAFGVALPAGDGGAARG